MNKILEEQIQKQAWCHSCEIKKSINKGMTHYRRRTQHNSKDFEKMI